MEGSGVDFGVRLVILVSFDISARKSTKSFALGTHRGANAPRTPETVDWDAPAVRRHADGPAKGHGRVETRSIAARDLLPGALASFAHARQAFRVIRERTVVKTGATSTETAYGITSVDAGRAAPTACRPGTAATGRSRTATTTAATPPSARTPAASAPATGPDNATLNNIALAVVFHHGFRHVPEANLHFMMRRRDALDAILDPD